MNKFPFLLSVFLIMQFPAMTQVKNDINPFFTTYKTPYQVPPFDAIKPEHYLPAFEKGIAAQQAEIDAITNNKAVPTFENTIVAFDQSGRLLKKVSSVFTASIRPTRTPRCRR